MKTVAIIGTFDTKGEEFAYVKKRFEELGWARSPSTAGCSTRRPNPM